MTANEAKRIGGILLAAGGSSRFGRPKQLEEFQGVSLVRRAADALINSACDPVIAVLGAASENVKAEIEELPINICINQKWRDGASTSIKTGLAELLNLEPELAGTLIMLCDQPLVISPDIDRLLSEFCRTGNGIVAAQYREIAGAPAVFGRAFFSDLLSLSGDQGARGIIRSNKHQLRTIEMEHVGFDIDTPDDVTKHL